MPLQKQLYNKSIFLMVPSVCDIYLYTHGSIQKRLFCQKPPQTEVHTDGSRS